MVLTLVEKGIPDLTSWLNHELCIKVNEYDQYTMSRYQILISTRATRVARKNHILN